MGGHLVGKYLKEVENIDIVFGISGGHIERCWTVSRNTRFAPSMCVTNRLRHDGACLVDLYRQARRLLPHRRSGICQRSDGIANAFLDNAPLSYCAADIRCVTI